MGVRATGPIRLTTIQIYIYIYIIEVFAIVLNQNKEESPNYLFYFLYRLKDGYQFAY